MKKIKKAVYVLMFLPLIAVLFVLKLLPEIVPMHYSLHGEVDRWGSKYELLVLPVFTMIMGAFLLFMSRLAKKKETDGGNNQKITLFAALMTLMIFNVITGITIYTGLYQVKDFSSTGGIFERLIYISLGMFFIVFGNFIPKFKRNDNIGFDMPDALKNYDVRKDINRFVGVSSVIAGLCMIIVSCIIEGSFRFFIFNIGIIILAAIIDGCYACVIARKYNLE